MGMMIVVIMVVFVASRWLVPAMLIVIGMTSMLRMLGMPGVGVAVVGVVGVVACIHLRMVGMAVVGGVCTMLIASRSLRVGGFVIMRIGPVVHFHLKG